MKISFYPICFSLFILASCGTKANDADRISAGNTSEATTETSPKDQAKCYHYFGEKDTVYLQLSEVYGTMTGMLLYKLNQKDQNLGTLEGKMKGDVLIADYSFKSEGVMSVRQVAFKRSGNDFVEGFGDMSDVNGKMSFKNPEAIKFEDYRVYTSVPCKQ